MPSKLGLGRPSEYLLVSMEPLASITAKEVKFWKSKMSF
jgi:hypothetical protein